MHPFNIFLLHNFNVQSVFLLGTLVHFVVYFDVINIELSNIINTGSLCPAVRYNKLLLTICMSRVPIGAHKTVKYILLNTTNAVSMSLLERTRLKYFVIYLIIEKKPTSIYINFKVC